MDPLRNLKISVVIPDENHIRLREPFFIHYEITNKSQESTFTFYVGHYRSRWFDISLRRGSEKQTRMVPDPRNESPSGLRSEPYVRLSPGRTWRGDIVASQYIHIEDAGRYQMDFNAILYYRESTSALNIQNSLINRSGFLASAAIHKADFILTFDVKPCDEAALFDRVNRLSRQYLSEPIGDVRSTYAEALCSLPSRYSELALYFLGSQDKADKERLGQAILQMNNEAAARILARLAYESRQTPNALGNYPASHYLWMLSEQDNFRLLPYIKGLMQEYGVTRFGPLRAD